MAAMQAQRQGGGVVLAVVTILIILALIGGYVPVILALDPYVKTADRLDSLLQGVYDTLTEAGAKLKKEVVSRDQPSGFEADFMNEIKRLALLGLKYEDLAKKVGYEGKEAESEVTQEIKNAQGGAKGIDRPVATMRQYVTELRESLGKERSKSGRLNEQRRRDVKQAKDLSNLLQAAQDKVGQIEKQLQEEKTKTRQIHEQENVKLTQANRRLNRQLDKSAQGLQLLTDNLKKDREAAESKITNLTQENDRLRRELARKAPKKVKKVEGEVISCDMIREYAIVGIGSRQGMELGDKVKIYRMGKAGIRVLKADGTVVSVTDFISRVDLANLDMQYPVIKGDIVTPLPKKAPGK